MQALHGAVPVHVPEDAGGNAPRRGAVRLRDARSEAREKVAPDVFGNGGFRA